MKRILFTATVLAIAVSIGFAQTTTKEQTKTTAKTQAQTVAKSQRGSNFVDADGDGICDNFAGKTGTQGMQGKRMGKGAGNGTCNGTGMGSGKGPGTGTGVCDGTGPKGYRGGQK